MKKNLLLGFLLLFLLSTTAFGGISDPKKGNDKPASSPAKENKLSDEEVSRLSRRAETDNLKNPNMSNNENASSANKLRTSNQVIVESGSRHHGGYILYGGGTLLLIIILVLILA
jgi:hypothetical protein